MNIYAALSRLRHLVWTVECRIHGYARDLESDQLHAGVTRVLQRAAHEIELLSFDVMEQLLQREQKDLDVGSERRAYLRAIEHTKELQATYVARRQERPRVASVETIEDALRIEKLFRDVEAKCELAFREWGEADAYLARLECPDLELNPDDIDFLQCSARLAVADTEGEKIILPIRMLIEEEKRNLAEKEEYTSTEQEEYCRERLQVLDMLAEMPETTDQSFVASFFRVYEEGAKKLAVTYRRRMDFSALLNEERAFFDRVLAQADEILERAMRFKWDDVLTKATSSSYSPPKRRASTEDSGIIRIGVALKPFDCGTFRVDAGDEVRVHRTGPRGSMTGQDPYGNFGELSAEAVAIDRIRYQSPIPVQTLAQIRDQLLSVPPKDAALQEEFDVSFEFGGRVFDWRVCALLRGILLQGKLYICDTCLAFFSYFNEKTVFGSSPTLIAIPWDDIIRLEKASNMWIPNSIEIFTKTETYFLTSFVERDATYNTLTFLHRMSRVAGAQEVAMPEPVGMPPHLNGKTIDSGTFGAPSDLVLDTLFLDCSKEGFLWKYFGTRNAAIEEWPEWSPSMERTIRFKLPVLSGGKFAMNFAGTCCCTEQWKVTRLDGAFVAEVLATMTDVPFSDIMSLKYNYRGVETDGITAICCDVEVVWSGSCMFKSFIESRIYSDFEGVLAAAPKPGPFVIQASAAVSVAAGKQPIGEAPATRSARVISRRSPVSGSTVSRASTVSRTVTPIWTRPRQKKTPRGQWDHARDLTIVLLGVWCFYLQMQVTTLRECCPLG